MRLEMKDDTSRSCETTICGFLQPSNWFAAVSVSLGTSVDKIRYDSSGEGGKAKPAAAIVIFI